MNYFYHYFERGSIPFRSLTLLPKDEADLIFKKIIEYNPEFSYFKKYGGHLERRRVLEAEAQKLFKEKGGLVALPAPLYMSLGKSDFIASWFVNPEYIKIPISEFNTNYLSFCYGDIFPIFRESADKGEEYRKQIYTYCEIKELIKKYGFPQEWNPNGENGDIRYIEVHVWDDAVLSKYRENYMKTQINYV